VLGLPYDPADPPADPPAGVDRLMWTVAHELRAAHESGPDGFCQALRCRAEFTLWPCAAVKLADAGLMGAVGWWTSPEQWPVTNAGGPARPDQHAHQTCGWTVAHTRPHTAHQEDWRTCCGVSEKPRAVGRTW
jgi:hypothetical protein